MNKGCILMLALIVALALPTLATAQNEGRGVLFQIGAGAYFPSYPGQLEADFSYVDSLPGVDRLKLSLDVALGVAVSQEAYLMARVDGAGDRVYSSSEWLQMNLYLFSVGFRYYPEVTGFYLEGEVGASKAVVQASSGVSSSSDLGFGFGAALGYDFNRNPRGFGLSIEAKYDSLTVESDKVGALMLTLNLCWK